MNLRRFNFLRGLLTIFILPGAVALYTVRDSINFKNFVILLVGLTILMAIWDIWSTRHGKKDKVWLWQYHKGDTLGIMIYNLPLEEYFLYSSAGFWIIPNWELLRLASANPESGAATLLMALAVWTLLAVSLPFLFRPKGDR